MHVFLCRDPKQLPLPFGRQKQGLMLLTPFLLLESAALTRKARQDGDEVYVAGLLHLVDGG